MLQVKKCNLARALSFCVLNSRTRTICFALLCSVFCILTGCKKDKESEPVDPFVTPGDTPNPNWVITGDNDMSASMTSIVKVSFTKSKGTLAAFIGNECRGIATYKADYDLYWLYISPETHLRGYLYFPLPQRFSAWLYNRALHTGVEKNAITWLRSLLFCNCSSC